MRVTSTRLQEEWASSLRVGFFAEVVILAYQGWLKQVFSRFEKSVFRGVRILIPFAHELVLSTTMTILAHTRIRVWSDM